MPRLDPPEHSRFKKGESGNPAGRPKGLRSFKTVFEEILERTKNGVDPIDNKPKELTMQEWLAMKMLAKAVRGDMRAAEMILDRIEGKPNQAVKHTGWEGKEIILSWGDGST